MISIEFDSTDDYDCIYVAYTFNDYYYSLFE
jgi:hypothetical protein